MANTQISSRYYWEISSAGGVGPEVHLETLVLQANLVRLVSTVYRGPPDHLDPSDQRVIYSGHLFSIRLAGTNIGFRCRFISACYYFLLYRYEIGTIFK